MAESPDGWSTFSGEQHLADFDVADDGERISMSIRARDGEMQVEIRANEAERSPESSCFASLAESSEFFEGGSVGFSVTRDCCRLDGIQLETGTWKVRALEVEQVESSFFAGVAFPSGSAVFDHALIMRDIDHEWRPVSDMHIDVASA